MPWHKEEVNRPQFMAQVALRGILLLTRRALIVSIRVRMLRRYNSKGLQTLIHEQLTVDGKLETRVR